MITESPSKESDGLDADQWSVVVRSLPIVEQSAKRWARGRDLQCWYDSALDGMIRSARTIPEGDASPDFVRFARYNIRCRMIDRARRRKMRREDTRVSLETTGHNGHDSFEPTDAERPIALDSDEAFEALLAKLPPRTAALFRLRFRDDVSIKEAARSLGICYQYAKQMERSALEYLWEVLGGPGKRPRIDRPRFYSRPRPCP